MKIAEAKEIIRILENIRFTDQLRPRDWYRADGFLDGYAQGREDQRKEIAKMIHRKCHRHFPLMCKDEMGYHQLAKEILSEGIK